jgi:hypothetical protein
MLNAAGANSGKRGHSMRIIHRGKVSTNFVRDFCEPQKAKKI